MFLKKSALLITLFALLSLTISNAYAGYAYYNNKPTVSVFLAEESRSSESGLGISLTTNEQEKKDITYVDFRSSRMLQVSTSTSKDIMGYPINVGIVLGYAEPKSGHDGYKGVTSGLQATLARTVSKTGLSIDLRLCSLSHDISPLKWVSNPDILWGGLGASFAF